MPTRTRSPAEKGCRKEDEGPASHVGYQVTKDDREPSGKETHEGAEPLERFKLDLTDDHESDHEADLGRRLGPLILLLRILGLAFHNAEHQAASQDDSKKHGQRQECFLLLLRTQPYNRLDPIGDLSGDLLHRLPSDD